MTSLTSALLVSRDEYLLISSAFNPLKITLPVVDKNTYEEFVEVTLKGGEEVEYTFSNLMKYGPFRIKANDLIQKNNESFFCHHILMCSFTNLTEHELDKILNCIDGKIPFEQMFSDNQPIPFSFYEDFQLVHKLKDNDPSINFLYIILSEMSLEQANLIISEVKSQSKENQNYVCVKIAQNILEQFERFSDKKLALDYFNTLKTLRSEIVKTKQQITKKEARLIKGCSGCEKAILESEIFYKEEKLGILENQISELKQNRYM